VALFFEPLSKLLIGIAGGTGALGLYELASRLVVQVRTLVLGGATPLLPLMSAISDPLSLEFRALLVHATRVSVWVSLMVCLLSLTGAPVMSMFLLGYIDADLLSISAVLTWGWALNIFSVPLYFAAQAAGILRWNFISHAILAVSVAAFGLGLSAKFGVYGVVIGVAVGLATGMCVTLFGNVAVLGQTGLLRAIRTQLLLIAAAITMLSAAAIVVARLILAVP
jgi:O-antigen/teichoic acid export membrane protein